MAQLVLRPVSFLLRPSLSVKELKIMSSYFMQIIVMFAVCAHIVIVALCIIFWYVR